MTAAKFGFLLLCSLAAVIAAAEWAQAAPVSQSCAIAELATFSNRVHIRCTFDPQTMMTEQGSGLKTPPPYFAVEATSPMAASIVQIALAALVNKRKLTLQFDDNSSNNPTDCGKSDCRRLIALVIR